jgi:hypothetical protein
VVRQTAQQFGPENAPAFSAYGTSLCLTAHGAFRPFGSPQGAMTRDAAGNCSCFACIRHIHVPYRVLSLSLGHDGTSIFTILIKRVSLQICTGLVQHGFDRTATRCTTAPFEYLIHFRFQDHSLNIHTFAAFPAGVTARTVNIKNLTGHFN